MPRFAGHLSFPASRNCRLYPGHVHGAGERAVYNLLDVLKSVADLLPYILETPDMQQTRKIIKVSLLTLSVLVGILVVHIFWVTRTRVDRHTRVMERIDLNEPIGNADAGRITGWLYRQPGVDHVMCNVSTSIVIFTYSPLQADGNALASGLSGSLGYPRAKRFMPTTAQLQSSCPFASPFSERATGYIKNLFNH